MSEVNFDTTGIDTTEWETMTLSELIEQRNKLYEMYEYVMKKPYASAFMDGLNNLDAIIAQKLK